MRDDLGSWKIEIGNSEFGRGRWRGLGEAVGAGAEEIEEAEVAEVREAESCGPRQVRGAGGKSGEQKRV